VKALFVYASNPAVSIPHQTKVLRGLARDDLFTVVVEHFLTDTTRYADIVLPATMAIEHRDLLIAYGHSYVTWNEPAMPPRRVPAHDGNLSAARANDGPRRARPVRQ
jgi:anaerobic selenocysteine-containing dehydrogenase